MFRLTFAVALCALACSAAATTDSSSAAPKKTAKKAVHPAATKAPAKTGAKPVAKTTASKSGTTVSKARSAKAPVRAKRAVRSTQQAPTADRYKEIQAALIDKGYLQGEATGEWGPDSVEALRRFQADENLNVDGKIGALSLIALGLGPKRLSAQAPPPTQSPAQPSAAPLPPPPPPSQPAADPPSAESHDSVRK